MDSSPSLGLKHRVNESSIAWTTFGCWEVDAINLCSWIIGGKESNNQPTIPTIPNRNEWTRHCTYLRLWRGGHEPGGFRLYQNGIVYCVPALGRASEFVSSADSFLVRFFVSRHPQYSFHRYWTKSEQCDFESSFPPTNLWLGGREGASLSINTMDATPSPRCTHYCLLGTLALLICAPYVIAEHRLRQASLFTPVFGL